MDENKKRVKHCPNFYKIMNFIFFDDDPLSKKIVCSSSHKGNPNFNVGIIYFLLSLFI